MNEEEPEQKPSPTLITVTADLFELLRRMAHLRLGDCHQHSGKRRSPFPVSEHHPNKKSKPMPMMMHSSDHVQETCNSFPVCTEPNLPVPSPVFTIATVLTTKRNNLSAISDKIQEPGTCNPSPELTELTLPSPVLATATVDTTKSDNLSSALTTTVMIPELLRPESAPFLSPGVNEMLSADQYASLRRSVSNPIDSLPEVASDVIKTKDDSSPLSATPQNPTPMEGKSPNSLVMSRQEEETEELAVPEEEDVRNNKSVISKQEEEISRSEEGEKEVKVDRIEDGFIIKLRCPNCGKGYHILVCGKSCFYKLL